MLGEAGGVHVTALCVSKPCVAAFLTMWTAPQHGRLPWHGSPLTDQATTSERPLLTTHLGQCPRHVRSPSLLIFLYSSLSVSCFFLLKQKLPDDKDLPHCRVPSVWPPVTLSKICCMKHRMDLPPPCPYPGSYVVRTSDGLFPSP